LELCGPRAAAARARFCLVLVVGDACFIRGRTRAGSLPSPDLHIPRAFSC
jgi:hypothetical protein